MIDTDLAVSNINFSEIKICFFKAIFSHEIFRGCFSEIWFAICSQSLGVNFYFSTTIVVAAVVVVAIAVAVVGKIFLFCFASFQNDSLFTSAVQLNCTEEDLDFVPRVDIVKMKIVQRSSIRL